MQDRGRLNNISADSAAVSGASIDFLREVGGGGSGDQDKTGEKQSPMEDGKVESTEE